MQAPGVAWCTLCLVLLLGLLAAVGQEAGSGEHCFCQLKGQLEDCTCSVDTVDHFNNDKVYPRLKSLLVQDFFRFYQVDLGKECPFWKDDSRCAIRFCHIQKCPAQDVPAGLKGSASGGAAQRAEPATAKYLRPDGCVEEDHDEELSYLNTTITAEAYQEFALWKAHDDAQDNFCVQDDKEADADYVDLLLNPERYTGYKGESAHRIWKTIYLENCFRPNNSFKSVIQHDLLNDLCLEKRVFYRAISGLHASINIHLCSNYLLSEKGGFVSKEGVWGPNLNEFLRRFDPKSTDGEGVHWLKNLYFVYLLELRALDKAANYLGQQEYFTGNDVADQDVRAAIKDLMMVVRSFPDHFNESVMFTGGQQASKLKEEFRNHFRNISRIMDCVGCDKCKLWGKLQTRGLGTALKILFSGKFDLPNPPKGKFQLQRNEIVALMNGFGRLSTSIYELEKFRKMTR